MPVSPTPPVTAHFAGFRLNLRAGELQDDSGKTARLPDQPFRILKTLLEHPGEVVTREELRKCLWPNDTIVEFEHSISAAMNSLRQALSDSAENPHLIETLARRGYRFMVPVQFETLPRSNVFAARPKPHPLRTIQTSAPSTTLVSCLSKAKRKANHNDSSLWSSSTVKPSSAGFPANRSRCMKPSIWPLKLPMLSAPPTFKASFIATLSRPTFTLQSEAMPKFSISVWRS